MSSSLNKVILIGHVGQDPVMRAIPNTNKKLATFSLATSESFKDKTSGERKTNTTWHKVVIFNEMLAEIVEKYVQKGAFLYIQGQLQTRKWTDDKKIDHYTTEVCVSQYKGELLILEKRNAPGNSAVMNTNHFSEGITLIPLPNDFDDIPDEIPF
jgi:single-strand DNA-binding protein